MTRAWDIGVGSLPAAGGMSSGDAAWLHEVDGRLRIVVLDVSGHGQGAADTCAGLEEGGVVRAGLSVLEQVEALHLALRGTRGAAALVVDAQAHGRTASVLWAGVGNVRLWTCRSASHILTGQAGTLGIRVPRRLRTGTLTLAPDSTLGLHTDGVRDDGVLPVGCSPTADLESTARALVQTAARRYDDATIVLARVLPRVT